MHTKCRSRLHCNVPPYTQLTPLPAPRSTPPVEVVRLKLQAREIPKLLIARAQAIRTSTSLPLHPVIVTLKGILQVNILTQLGVLAAAAGLGVAG